MTNEEIVLSLEFDEVVSVFCNYYRMALENEKIISKPISWSLYKAYEYFDLKEE